MDVGQEARTGVRVVVLQAVADGRSGILVEPGNVDALAAAMLLLLDDRALAGRLRPSRSAAV